MINKKISLFQAIDIIVGIDNKFFTVEFIKRTNNKLRIMNCRRNVKKYLKNGKLKFNPMEKGLIPTWCRNKKDYRFINLFGLQKITFKDITYKVE